MAHAYIDLASTNSALDPVTFAHAPASPASVMIVSMVIGGTSARTGSAPSIDGVACSQADQARFGVEENVEVWYLCGAFSTASHTISIGNTKLLTMNCLSLAATAGRGQNSYLLDSTGSVYATWAVDTFDGDSINITSGAVGDFLFARLGCGEASTDSVSESSINPAKTTIYSADPGAYTSYAYYGVSDGAGEETFTWAWTNDDGCAILASFGSSFRPPPQVTRTITKKELTPFFNRKNNMQD